MIQRDKYLTKLINGMKNDQIKVVTGIRRCGKSYLLSRIFRDYLLQQKIKGRKYIGSNSKYYFQDIGIRNAILNFRQIEQSHIMENIIYNELLYRGYNVDVGLVEFNDHSKRVFYEADFVCNKADKRLYVQSAFSITDEEKYEQETRSLSSIKDFHRKVIITQDNIYTHYTEEGFLILRLDDFLNGYEL